MPQHHPEDRVRVKNIVMPVEKDEQTFFLTRYRKQQQLDANGTVVTRQVPYVQEVVWNFQDGFFFLWGGKGYVLRPGEERTYPRFLAEHCAKQQVQYVVNKRYEASKKVLENGMVAYTDRGVLSSENEKKKIRDTIFMGVEEWYEGSDDDLDTVLNRKFGSDTDGYLSDEEVPADERDYVVPVDEEKASLPQPEKAQRTRKVVSDERLQKMRDEADAFQVEWDDSDTADQVKEKVLKSMA